MTNLSDLLPAGAASKQLSFTASGTITSGKPVVLNDNGTVSQIASDARSVSEAVGSAAVYESAASEENGIASNSTGDKLLIAYKDNANSNYGTAVVATLSGTTLTYGTPVVFKSSSTVDITVVYSSTADKFVISWNQSGGRSIVGTVSGTTVSFGSENQWSSNNLDHTVSAYDSGNDKIVVAYQDGTQSDYGFSRVGTISGTSISFGSETQFSTSSHLAVFQLGITYDSTNSKIIIVYGTGASSSGKGRASVGTVSGTSISFGSPTIYGNNEKTLVNRAVHDVGQNKIFVAYRESATVYGIIGTVSGTSISFGTRDSMMTADSSTNYASVAYHTAAQKVVYSGRKNNAELTAIICTVSGTTFAKGSDIKLEDSGDMNQSAYNAAAEQIVVAYKDVGNSNYGTAITITPAYTATNLTSTNFLGIADAAISNAASGNITMKGGVVTNSQLLPFAYTGSLGSAAVYQSTATEYQGIAFDSSNNKIVVAYKDDSNQHGTCAVGTVSGTSISWGTPVVFAAASTSYVDVTFDSSNNKVVIVYSDVANSEYGTAIVGTVSGTSISFGSEVVFASAATVYIKAGFDSNANKVVVAYSDNGNSSYGTAIVGTVSGTSISFGTEVVVDSTGSLSAAFGGFVFDSTNNKVVIPYSIAGGATYGIVGTVSGTSISFGTRVAIGSVSGQNLSVAFDSNAGKVVINYRDANNSDYTGSVVGTVSGTSISFGTELVIEEVHNLGATTFDSSDNKIIFFYKSSSLGYYRIGTVSGTSISYGSAVSLISNNLAYMAATFDSNQNTSVVVYKDTGNSNYGTAKGLQVSGSYPNLVPNTTYYVQDDGTLSTTSSSVTAGKAMSTNSINLDYST
jgi:hypothetical protein